MAWLRLLCLGAALVIAPAVDAAAEPRRVLLLHSFGRNFEPFISLPASFREEIVRRSPQPIELQEASIEILKPGDAVGESAFVRYLNTLFPNGGPDAIVTFGGPAANLLMHRRPELFPATPLLMTGVEQRRIQSDRVSSNEVIASFSLDIKRYIENILRVRPDTSKVSVVSGASPFDKFWLSEMQREFRPFFGRIAFDWLHNVPFEDVLKRAANLPPQSAIFFATLVVDASGIPYDQERALKRLNAVANAPIFGVADYHFGHGIIGGPMFSTLELGHRAAEIALRLLDGESPADLRVPALGADVNIYDGRELKRWNISENLLPQGSEVRFRQPTLLQEYKTQIAVGIAVLLLQAAMITWLLIESVKRHRAEAQSRRHLLEVIHLNRTAGAGVMSAAIAHEINQPLGAILANAEAGQLLLDNPSPDMGQLKEILADIRQADQHAGAVILRLRQFLKKRSDIQTQEFDVNDALAATIQILSPEARRRGVTLTAHPANAKLRARADQIHIQQVMINIAINGMDAMRDCPPERRSIVFRSGFSGQSEIQVTIADRGPGISPDKLANVFEAFYTTKEQGTGLGLSITRTIIETYGGRVWADNSPEGGAVFHFTLPSLATT